MSQKLIIGILSVVIIAGGGIWYSQSAKENAATGSQDNTRVSEKEKNGILDAIKSGSDSFAEILSGGSAQECRFSGVDPETKEDTEGTIFVDGESFRMEAETTANGETGTINIIQHEKVMYMWSDEDPTGMKIDANIFEGMEGVEPEEKPESPIDWLKDPESDVDYDCNGWVPRSNTFTPPEDVQFIDMFGAMGGMFGEMMQQGMTGEFEAEEEADAWSY